MALHLEYLELKGTTSKHYLYLKEIISNEMQLLIKNWVVYWQ